MCFTLYVQGRNLKAKEFRLETAQKSIIAYKKVNRDLSPHIMSHFPKYKIGRTYQALKRCVKHDGTEYYKKIVDLKRYTGKPSYSSFLDETYLDINEGIHSYRKIYYNLYSEINQGALLLVVRIPKGAKYLENNTEIVSNKIIPIKALNKTQLKKWEKLGYEIKHLKQL